MTTISSEDTIDVEITKKVAERRTLYASTIYFRGSRVFFETEDAARSFAPWLWDKNMFPFEKAAGALAPTPENSLLELEINER